MTATLPWLLPATLAPDVTARTRAYAAEHSLPAYDPPTVFPDDIPQAVLDRIRANVLAEVHQLGISAA